jgi:hypothetical protein
MAVPKGWLVDRSRNTPIYFSFSPAEAADFNNQLKLPKGGAVISVVALDEIPAHYRSVSEWAVADAKGNSAGTPSVKKLDLSSDTGVGDAIISTYDTKTFSEGERPEHHVSVFWEFRQRLFAAHLMYLAHDSKGNSFEGVLLETMNSLRGH